MLDLKTSQVTKGAYKNMNINKIRILKQFLFIFGKLSFSCLKIDM